MCANGAPCHKFVPRDESKSLKITMELLLPTMVIDAYEDRKVAAFNVHKLYPQIDLPKDKFTLLFMEGEFVDIMCDINTEYK